MTIIAQSLVLLSPFPVENIPKTDWIFFYSKNGVRFFFQALRAIGLQLPNDLRFGVIGSGTAETLAKERIQADFIGTGEPQSTATNFLPLAKGKSVLFPQAAHSKQSIQKQLEGAITILPLVVYKNEPLKDFDLPHCDLLVFTSPMNAAAYFNRYPFVPNQKVVAIGETTATALRSLGVKEVFIAKEPSEISLAQAVLDILKLE